MIETEEKPQIRVFNTIQRVFTYLGGYLLFVPYLDTLLRLDPTKPAIALNLAFLIKVMQMRTETDYELLNFEQALSFLEVLLGRFKGETKHLQESILQAFNFVR